MRKLDNIDRKIMWGIKIKMEIMVAMLIVVNRLTPTDCNATPRAENFGKILI